MTQTRTWVGTSWKMTRTIAESRAYARELRAALLDHGRPDGVQLFVLPAHTALAAVAEELADVPDVWVGAQSAHPGPEGAGTGEVSVRMVAEAGARLVEIGHSERRAARAEDDAFVAASVRAVLDAGLVPLVCVGEPLEARRSGRAVDHVVAQAHAALSPLEPREVADVVLAYEPVWAVGSSGRPARPDEVAPVVAAVADHARDLGGGGGCRVGPGLRALLYGGSVDVTTAPGMLDVPGVDGVFVGRAAWEARGLLRIARAAAARSAPPRPPRTARDA